MRLMTLAALAALPLSTLTTTAPALAADPTSSGSFKAYAISKLGPNEVEVTGSIRCTSDDTVTLDILVSQTVTGAGQPAPSGGAKATVKCTPKITDHKFRVPITKDGPLNDRPVAIATDMFNSAGTKIATDGHIARFPSKNPGPFWPFLPGQTSSQLPPLPSGLLPPLPPPIRVPEADL
ncbi:hypothetical protein Acor_41040 [Acrocarpospora corrugata]|uniref:Lipoprotein n=1 Tax=Acrocarpospora corrugata TaxID=35763 RepID=A0A5M3W166_9ACTN|nr:hypothetical protein [Acrocarpospora corrugata]GES02039.1 hypothetical protein Acor_41040 [Acrocarpospora corrugata]